MHRIRRATAYTLLFATCAFAQSGADVRSFDSGGVPISYIDRGGGQPVLLLHGFTRSFKDWEAGLIPQLLADGFRVIAYDSRGHGASGKPDAPEQYGQEDVNDAIRLLDHLGIDNAHIVGYSRAASIASESWPNGRGGHEASCSVPLPAFHHGQPNVRDVGLVERGQHFGFALKPRQPIQIRRRGAGTTLSATSRFRRASWAP